MIVTVVTVVTGGTGGTGAKVEVAVTDKTAGEDVGTGEMV